MKKISILMLFMLGTLVTFTACKNDKAAEATTEGTEQEVQAQPENTQEAAMEIPEGAFVIDTEGSNIEWFGRKVSGKHNGTIDFKGGYVEMDGDNITGGEVVIDMESITVKDLEGEWKTKLENHLKGFDEGKEDHFFDVAKHPTADFKITKVTTLEGSDKGNIMVYGDMTIKGKTNSVAATAFYAVDENRMKVEIPELVLDRTKWGVNFNSKTVWEEVTDDFIYDDIKLSIRFEGTKS
jgi:polyisoprenoid-binding protein YceI